MLYRYQRKTDFFPELAIAGDGALPEWKLKLLPFWIVAKL